jgi:hypothetical protein
VSQFYAPTPEQRPTLERLAEQAGSGPHVGIGRISTGLGCPHAETDPDFLGLMVAFRAGDGRLVDFVTINHGGGATPRR